jgi:hypothetical protein
MTDIQHTSYLFYSTTSFTVQLMHLFMTYNIRNKYKKSFYNKTILLQNSYIFILYYIILYI